LAVAHWLADDSQIGNVDTVPYQSVNPSTGEVIDSRPALTRSQLEGALATTHEAARSWRLTSFDERAQLMVSAAELIEGEIPVIGELLTSEMGKTFAAAKGEAAKCALAMRYFAEHAESLLAEELIATSASRSGVRYDPLGAVLAIMPWNFPLWQVIRFAAPNLMAGNVGLLKHASNVPGAAEFLGNLFTRAGFPPGVFTNLFVDVKDIAGIIADDRVAAVTLTGSERAGRAVASAAGQNLKKAVMELGGSDAFVVADSADLATTVPLAVAARLQNNGQSCIAAKRFIVVQSRATEFLEQFAQAMAAAPIGDPMEPSTVLGPVVSASQRDELDSQVRDSVARGARILAGGAALDGRGFFYPATVLADVADDSRAGCEELFGPVAVVSVVPDLSAAVERANATPWGLGGSIWAEDPDEIEFAIRGIDAGMVFANAVVVSTPELPFGGVKNSGFGRELSAVGIREFTNIKTFFVK
jgi:succinate-semialdehyde dehydrogenase / glutarate-semialdehyde dehydrogenase